MYLIGKVINTFGIKGEVKIVNLSDFDRFLISMEVLVFANDQEIKLKIARSRIHKGYLIVKFWEFNNIDDVLFLKNQELYAVNRAALANNEYYYDQLIGKRVISENQNLGLVSGIIEIVNGHIIEVENGAKKLLIPFNEHFIGKVSEDIVVTNLRELYEN